MYSTRTNFQLGTILINPGGPGGSGTAMVHEFGSKISKIIGPEFDLLGFDPRGTGATLPRADCFTTNAQSEIWDLQQGPVLNLSDISIPQARSRAQVLSERCWKALGGDGNGDSWAPGRYMGTASVATDMLRIVEKLGQDKLQYWGVVSFFSSLFFVISFAYMINRVMAPLLASISRRCTPRKSAA